ESLVESISSVVFSFLFSADVDRRGLPSFPTRRSSDLFGVLGFSDFTLNSSMGLLTSLTIALALVVDFIFLPALLGVVDSRQSAQDRKSTRLNSSHVKISYAVFCLKKRRSRR